MEIAHTDAACGCRLRRGAADHSPHPDRTPRRKLGRPKNNLRRRVLLDSFGHPSGGVPDATMLQRFDEVPVHGRDRRSRCSGRSGSGRPPTRLHGTTALGDTQIRGCGCGRRPTRAERCAQRALTGVTDGRQRHDDRGSPTQEAPAVKLAAADGRCPHRVIRCAACGAVGCGLVDCDQLAFEVSYHARPVATCQSCGARIELEQGVRPVGS